jgi:malonyl-CoA/methylmalonyl-CoA synthetase
MKENGSVREQSLETAIEDDWRAHLPQSEAAWRTVPDDASLPSVWGALWTEHPDAVALVDLTSDQEVTYTRAQLEARSAAAAHLLRKCGVSVGDRVLFSGAPSTPYLFLYIGALRAGATIVPANTAYTAAELEHLVADSGATVAVVDDPARLNGAPLHVVDVRDAIETPTGATEEAAALDRARADDLAMIAYTSGTTGRPKGALLSHRNLLASARSIIASWRWTEADGLVLALPLFHLHGLGVGLHGSLLSGGRVLLLPGFKPELVARASARDDATLFFGVPTMHKRLVEYAESDRSAREALASLRLVVSGSAPLSEEMWQRAADVLGQRILERYGMTETVMNISNPYDGERRPGTVGIPLPGVEIALHGGGSTGEILIRGENVSRGYWRDDDATRAAFTAQGWFRSGDIGERSEDGYISIVGRSKELIISGGYNVYPREVEEALETHPDVAEAVVVGLPSADWGETVAAGVVTVAGGAPPSEQELIEFLAERLAGYKKPRTYRFIAAVPRNALGKISRAAARELFS